MQIKTNQSLCRDASAGSAFGFGVLCAQCFEDHDLFMTTWPNVLVSTVDSHGSYHE